MPLDAAFDPLEVRARPVERSGEAVAERDVREGRAIVQVEAVTGDGSGGLVNAMLARMIAAGGV